MSVIAWIFLYFSNLARHEFARVINAPAKDDETQVAEPLLRQRLLQYVIDRHVELLEHVRRRPLAGDQGVPSVSEKESGQPIISLTVSPAAAWT